MNMKKWLKFNPYKKLWSLIGGRKWTYIMRDFAYQNPMLVFLLGFGLGMLLWPYMDIHDLWKGFAALLLAHLFWGTKWQKGQRGG